MRAILLSAALALASVSAALAGNWTGQRIGNFDYWNSDDGASYSGQQIGNYYYWNGVDQYGESHSGTSYRIGNFTYYDGD